MIEGLSDIRYVARERSEQELKNMGPVILAIIESLPLPSELEAQIRLGRVKAALSEMGKEDIQNRALIARGLAEALEYRPGNVECRSLVAGLDNLDQRVRLACIRSLGGALRDPGLAAKYGRKFHDRTIGDVESLDLATRNATLAAIGGIPISEGQALCKRFLFDTRRPISVRILALRILLERGFATKAIKAGLQGTDAKLLVEVTDLLAAQGEQKNEVPVGPTKD